jgi:hypothetical protein
MPFFVAHVYNSDDSNAKVIGSEVVEADCAADAGKQVAEGFQHGSHVRVAVHEVAVVEAVERMVPMAGKGTYRWSDLAEVALTALLGPAVQEEGR